MQEHLERLNKHLAEGTLIRGKWMGKDASGRETACLLAAMVPECGEKETSAVCPATIMPSWLAYLTPALDDKGSIDAWPGMVKRFADLASRWRVLDAAAWRRVQFTLLAAAVREAASHTKYESAVAVCRRIASLCDCVVTTGVIDAAEVETAWAEASEARVGAAALAAAEAAWAAEEAARAAAWSAGTAARAAAWAAGAAARAAEEAWDRMTVALFDAIEKELG